MKNTRLQILMVGALCSGVIAARAATEPTTSATPVVTYVNVSGNRGQFREDHWMKDNWSGGIEEFTTQQKLGKDWQLTLEGTGIFDEEDYRLNLEIAKPEFGYIRAGFSQFRKYFNDQGGFFKGLTPSSYSLDRDLALDNGKIYFEAGLRLPNLPKLTIGYERQYRDGTKSLLEWGQVTQGGTSRSIFPSYKDINETVDIVKVEVEHTIKNINLGDQFRYERDRNDTTRYDMSNGATTTIRESYQHDSFFNTFRMDTTIKEKVYLSLGYLYVNTSGDASLNVSTPGVLPLFQQNWMTQGIDLDSDSHVVNVNAMFGPFAGLSIYAGLQVEETDSHGLSDALLTQLLPASLTNQVRTSTDKTSFEETLGLRYTKIPFTTLYAEAKWTQQNVDLTETQLQNGGPDFARDTDTDISRQKYSVGFNTAPIKRWTFAGRYRHSISENDYDNSVDTTDGYPALIRAQDFTTDEVMAKLTWRPCNEFNVAFKYQWLQSDIRTTTDSIFWGVNNITPGGELTSGKHDSMIYTLSATVLPTARLYITGLFSLQDTHTAAFDNASPEVVSYKGDVYTGTLALGYALDEKTDLTAQYSYSRASNFQNNAAGLPLGMDNEMHGATVGISRRIKENITVRIRYAYYEYNDDATGGMNDYQAHLASASCTVKF